MSFVHLHVHSHYSLLDGLSQIDDLVAFAKADGAPAIALTDHGVMYGAIEFYQKCTKAGIKPIIGMEAYVAPDSRHNRDYTRGEKTSHHLVLLAKNYLGYKNLMKLTSLGHLEGFYYKPRLDWELLQEHHEGLIALSACLGGEISQLIMKGHLNQARERAGQYQELFGEGNYYLEIQHHPDLEHQLAVNAALIKLSQATGVGLVATNDAHYAKAEDDQAQDILLCLQNKTKKDDPNRMSMLGGNYSLRPASEMTDLFNEVPEAITNTIKIASKVDLKINLGNIQLPFFAVPEGHDGNSYLRELCFKGLVKRYGQDYDHIETEYRERLDYELAVVKKMGWPSYFLIVADFVNWAKDQDIVVGPGRGSAAGSLVCYLIGITNLCPIKYGLLFERFLNPERISMPDIDLDFADIRRGEVIEYVQRKYGYDHVAQIITFGTMAARAAIRDVGRVLDYPYDFCDKIAKSIPMFTTLSQALAGVPEFKDMYANEDAKKIIDSALKLEGVARHASTHACGVLITKDPLTENVPIQHASTSDKSIVSQYSLHPTEDLGLLKMDFLGLKNLTIIESAIKIIKGTRGLELDIDHIPLDNQAAYDLFQRAETTGVFQFESSGMKRYLRELKPSEFEDIIAMVALYRPGPMEWIPDYIAGKHGRKQPEYLHPKLEPILEKTYGVAIYQEQVMQMARDLAGFTMGQADVLRKAVGKKIVKLLEEQKTKFIDGCVKNGIDSELAKTIFSFIEPFAGYGFNRSHAACYALVGYQTAYLKANWPTEFMAALLTADQQDTDRVAIEIDECRQMGIEVKQPDINQSFETFTVVTSGTAEGKTIDKDEVPTTIRFGLKAIKNVGEHIAEVIIAQRKADGPFQSMEDFLRRIDDRDLNKKSLESLIKAGAFDRLVDRSQLLNNLDNLLNFHKLLNKEKHSNQDSLFGSLDIDLGPQLTLVAGEEIDEQQRLTWERDLLGLYVSQHPFTGVKEQIGAQLNSLGQLKEMSSGASVKIGGVITTIKKILTKKNETMMFVKIEDGVDSVEILVFPRLLAKTADVWQDGQMVVCGGQLSDKDSETKILADRCLSLSADNCREELKAFLALPENNFKRRNANGYAHNNGQNQVSSPPTSSTKPSLRLEIKQTDLAEPVMNELKEILSQYQGDSKVIINLVEPTASHAIEADIKVNLNQDLVKSIKAKFGNSIKVVA